MSELNDVPSWQRELARLREIIERGEGSEKTTPSANEISEERSPTKEEACNWLRFTSRLLELNKEEMSQRAARRLLIIADCIEGKRKYHKPPKLSLYVMQRLESAARRTQHYHEQGKTRDEALKMAMEELGLESPDATEHIDIEDRILAMRSRLLKK